PTFPSAEALAKLGRPSGAGSSRNILLIPHCLYKICTFIYGSLFVRLEPGQRFHVTTLCALRRCVLLVMAQTSKPVQLKLETVEAFQAYIRQAEAGMEQTLGSSSTFLWSDASPERAQ